MGCQNTIPAVNGLIRKPFLGVGRTPMLESYRTPAGIIPPIPTPRSPLIANPQTSSHRQPQPPQSSPLVMKLPRRRSVVNGRVLNSDSEQLMRSSSMNLPKRAEVVRPPYPEIAPSMGRSPTPRYFHTSTFPVQGLLRYRFSNLGAMKFLVDSHKVTDYPSGMSS